MRIKYTGPGLTFKNAVAIDKMKWVGIPRGSTGTVVLDGGHSLSDPANALVTVDFDTAIIAPRTSADPKNVRATVPFGEIEYLAG